MRLGWLFFLSSISTVCLAGFEVQLHELSEKALHEICKKDDSNRLCKDSYSVVRNLSNQFKILELHKSDEENHLFLSAGFKESNGKSPPILINFSHIKNTLAFCKFGLKIQAKKFTKELQEALFQNLDKGKSLKLLVQTGAMCDLLANFN